LPKLRALVKNSLYENSMNSEPLGNGTCAGSGDLVYRNDEYPISNTEYPKMKGMIKTFTQGWNWRPL
jgi:hypothetical protein